MTEDALPNQPVTLQRGLFDGDTYDDDQDRGRLWSQLTRVREFLGKGRWVTLEEISSATGYPEASISARIGDLRKRKFGSHLVGARRKKAGKGTWEYRLEEPGCTL